MTDINFGLKGSLRRYLTNALTARPVVDRSRCKLCNACVEHCPPAAMKITDRKLTINYNQCIRCFCCQELCPHAALATRQGGSAQAEQPAARQALKQKKACQKADLFLLKP